MSGMKRFVTAILSVCCAMAMAVQLPLPTFANSYQHVTRSTSYAHPDTGEIVDGGSKDNEALGNSMCASIVDDVVLIEKQGGKTFVTMGIGLMSNVSNVRFFAVKDGQTSPNQFTPISASKVGSCQRDGDRCDHYRFELPAGTKYISPAFFVSAMGRDVQFFVELNMGSIQPGRGSFDHAAPSKPKPSKPKPSAPVQAVKPAKPVKPAVQKADDVKKEDASKTEDQKEDQKETVKKDSSDKKTDAVKEDKKETVDKTKTQGNKAEEAKKDKKKTSYALPITLGVIAVAAVAGGLVIMKKRKG